MGVKTAGVGHFQIPTAPAAGTSVASFTKQEALRVRESYVPLIEIQRVAFRV